MESASGVQRAVLRLLASGRPYRPCEICAALRRRKGTIGSTLAVLHKRGLTRPVGPLGGRGGWRISPAGLALLAEPSLEGQILDLLAARGPQTQAAIQAVVRVSARALWKELAVLRQRHKVWAERRGLGLVYRLAGEEDPPAGAEPEAAAPRPPERRRRACLRCQRSFLSEGAHNRLCGACGQAVRQEAPGLEGVTA